MKTLLRAFNHCTRRRCSYAPGDREIEELMAAKSDFEADHMHEIEST